MIRTNFEKIARHLADFNRLNDPALLDISNEFMAVDRFMITLRPHLEDHLIDRSNPHLIRGSQILQEPNLDWLFGGTSVNDAILIYDDSISTFILRRNNQNIFRSDTTAHTFNPDGINTDFIIEGDTDQDLFYVDAGNDRVGISTSTPSTTLDVWGTFKVTGTSTFNSSIVIDNNVSIYWADSLLASQAMLVLDGSDIFTINPAGGDFDTRIEGSTDTDLVYVDAGNNRVGISTPTPNDTLEVAGTFRVTGQTVLQGALYHYNNQVVYWADSFGADIGLIVLDGSDIFTINPNGADIDTRIEGDTDVDLVYVDAGLDRVGISTSTPSVLFEVGGATKFDGASEVTGTMTLGSYVYMPNATSFYFKNNVGINYRWIEFDASNIFNINPAGVSYDSRIQGNTDANLIYVDASADKVGIGTATPGQKLEVNGAILVPNDTSVYGKNTSGTARNLIKMGAVDNILIGDNSGTGSDQWYAGGSIVLRVDGNTSSLNMLGLYSSPILVFNDGAQDMDMRWESASLANSFYFDGNNGRVGIGGTSAPATELHLYNSGSNARPIMTFEHVGDNALGGFILFRHQRTTGSTASNNDVAGTLRWQAYDATATPVEQQYLTMQGRVLSTGSGYVEGQLRIFAMDTAGSNNIVLQLGQGIQLGGAPTGGDKGLGTINVTSNIYKNNTAYTNPDYVLEHWVTGEIKKYADRPRAKDFVPMSIYEIEDHINRYYRLPGITDDPAGIFDMADIALELIERLYTVTIEQQYKIDQLERRINDFIQ